MRYPWWKPVLILLILAGCGALMYPPSQRLKPGLDLAGGTTLIYNVRVPQKRNSQAVINDLINVLRNRVDPNGTRNLVWKQIAGNRIQIQMALASPRAKHLRQVYLAQRHKLLGANLSPGNVNAILREDAPQRTRDLKDLAGNHHKLLQQLQQLARAHDRYVAAARPYEQAQAAFNQAQKKLEAMPSGAPDAGRKKLRQDVQSLQKKLIANTQTYLAAKQAFEAAQSKVFSANVDAAELEQALSAPLHPTRGGKLSRAQAVTRLKREHPGRAGEIQQVTDAYRAYGKVKGPLDDPNDLIDLLRGSGVLEYRIAAVSPALASNLQTDANLQSDAVDTYRKQLDKSGPRAGQDKPWRWFAVDDVDQFVKSDADRKELNSNPRTFFLQHGLIGQAYGSDYYVLLGATPDRAMTRDQKWNLSSASRGSDQLGRNAVDFTLDAPGADLMGAITGANVHKPMAILLDNKVISAPTLNSKISGRGQITGDFTNKELGYLLRTLHAGSSEAELADYPASINTTGPQLGQDNLRRGLQAAVISLIAVAIFMAIYYFFVGLVADFALLANMVIILGIMALFQATFTLPGIAGIVLTIGMAVDANVLIFERIREELERNADIATAVRLGFQKAFSTIVDANITTFITCVVLYYTATSDIKGFAVTLMVGILATLFTALFCSRVLVDIYLTYFSPKSLPMLPTVFATVRNLLSPNVDWLGKRAAFFTLSGVLMASGIAATYFRGNSMLDIEFRSGTQVAFNLKDNRTLPIAQVRQRLDAFGKLGATIQQAQAAGRHLKPASLPPAQQRLYPQLRDLVDRAQQRYHQQIVDARQQRRQGHVVGSVPDHPPRFGLLSQANVVTRGKTTGGQANGFSVATLITDTRTVSDVVKTAFSDLLNVKQPIRFADMNQSISAADDVYPVTSANLGQVLNRPGVTRQAPDYVGGAAIVLRNMHPAATTSDLHQRIQRMQLQPEYEELGYRPFEVLGLKRASGAPVAGGRQQFRSAVVLVRDQQTNYQQNPDALRQTGGLAATERALIHDALQRDTSLASVSNFSSQVSKTMQEEAGIAMILSLIAVIAYIWLRFGSLRYGLAAIVALVHDVTIALGLVAICGWIYDNGAGHFLLLTPFKVNLAIVAALLTIVGYSLNDTIVVFDRIRENRGRLSYATPAIINDSINQTISRTILTSGTTLLAVAILYVFGGPGVHGFAFTMLVGIIVGTYSSIAIASPMVLLGASIAQRRKSTDVRRAQSPSTAT